MSHTSNNASRKRPAPVPAYQPPPTRPALSQKDEFVDEDEALVSKDKKVSLATRLSERTRPPLSLDYTLQSRSIHAATAPNVGDRVSYVMIKAAKGAKAYEKSEDPIYVLENNIPIDSDYYLKNQISKPILRIFKPIIKNAGNELLHGNHTRSISAPSTGGGIRKFCKTIRTCVGCKDSLSNGDRTLCSCCKGRREAELYCKKVAEGSMWTQCQECQGSLHQDVLCTSRDCPIFYRRRKVQKEMAEARLQLDIWNF